MHTKTNRNLPSDQVLWDFHMKTLFYPLLLAADSLFFFDAFKSHPIEISELRNILKVGNRFLEICTSLFSNQNLIVHKNGCVELTETSKTYLLRSSAFYWGGMFELGKVNYPIFNEIIKAAKSDFEANFNSDHEFVLGWVKGEQKPEVVKKFTAAMQSQSLASAQSAARLGVFKNIHELLDVGAGSGCFSIEALKEDQELRCTLFDFPQVCEIAKDFATLNGVSDRISLNPGNFFSDTWPEGHDGILFSHILHDWPIETCLELLRKANESLEEGGMLFINEHLLDEDRRSPADTIGFSITMLIRTRGKQYTFSDIEQMLLASGFKIESSQKTIGPASIIAAKKGIIK